MKFPHCVPLFFSRYDSLRRHQANFHRINFTCDFCDKTFTKKYQLVKHNQENHVFECDICDMTFRARSNLRNHVREVHERVRNHQCNDCNRRFTRATNLRIHVQNVHNLMRNYQCEHCNERFGQLQNMIVHQVNVHQVHFMCSQCHQLYSNTPNADIASFPVKYMHVRNCFCQNII